MKTELSIARISEWGVTPGKKFIISGPCSAETEEQVMQTALALSKYEVNAFRAGIWKPRSRPGTFQGIGARGLRWLQKVQEATKMPVTVEVANQEHIEQCLEHGIDILWIGARTTANPFSVQAIADALKGVDIPVMVKNPINPDLGLWIGALERLNQVGIRKLAAIHRGFSSSESSLYRNETNWRIPIELRRRIPDMPLICDPSHICGNRKLLLPVAQMAMDLLFDGLMIESHIDPDSALSDAEQQLTPDQLGDLLSKIKIKKKYSADGRLHSPIDHLRDIIDEIDDKIIDLFSKRMEISREIGRFKRRKSISILQPERWKEIVESRIKAGRRKNLSEEFVFRVYEYIHEESIRQQEEVKGGAAKGDRSDPS
jgi:chorismate mutase